MFRALSYCSVVAGLLLAASPSAAQESALIDGTEPEKILSILKGFGSARLEKDSEGDPMISGRTGGQAYTLFFYDCEDGAECDSAQFWSYWDHDLPVEALNSWNKDMRYGKVYKDDDDDVVLEFDVSLYGGITEAAMEENAVLWESLISNVSKDLVKE